MKHPLLALSALAAFSAAAAAQRPNVVLVITDDQGYGDLGAHGNTKIRTPNLDALHAESVRLSNYHVDPTCSPTRSALMSGRYSTRTGVWHTIMGRSLMAAEETTLAERFAANGYRTGMFGKWHLGDNAPCRPQDQGFEHVVWHHGGGVGPGPDYWGNDYFDDTYEVNGAWRAFDGYCTDVWFEQATEFITREDARPFFVYLSTNAPHGPFHVDPSYSDPYVRDGVSKTMAKFYGMVTNIDENVGKLRRLLKETGLADNTVFMFTTDNGTAAGDRKRPKEEGTWPGYNAGMRGKKGSEYDGGHRVPFFVHWPKGDVGGGRDIDALAAHVDVMPTLTELCGLKPEPAAPGDGASFAGALRGAAPAPMYGRTLFVHSQRVEHPRKWRKCAVMTQRWRLINGEQLFDMRLDPGQREDVAGANPETVAQLRAAYEEWWRSLEPTFDDYVRIDLGGAQDPTHLMSHDWHTEDKGTPWNQSHVRSGYLGNGPWAVHVVTAGRYRVTLRRWPAVTARAMGCVEAAVEVGDAQKRAAISPNDHSATFELALPAGPAMLRTRLKRTDGKEHGAYFAQVQRIE
ncbi:MAG: arylsulfatase [Planctomycetota bacterium]|nr:arylsulfatase [Planctomycetota bacterium]